MVGIVLQRLFHDFQQCTEIEPRRRMILFRTQQRGKSKFSLLIQRILCVIIDIRSVLIRRFSVVRNIQNPDIILVKYD